MKYKRAIIAAFGDTHAGSNLGLVNPNTPFLNEKYPRGYSMTEPQIVLDELYTEHIKKVFELADGDDLIVLHLGDTTQGVAFDDSLFTTSIAEQIKLAEGIMLPWYEYKNLRAVRFAAGTAVHVFGDGTSEYTVDALLRGRFPKIDTKTVIHGLSEISGTWVDYAHHGPGPGMRTWLHGNNVRYNLRDIMSKELMHLHKIPAHIYFRGHTHSYVKEYLEMDYEGGYVDSWMITLPSYCMLGEFAVKATKSEFIVTNGMVACEVINGHLHQTQFFGKTTDIRQKEKIL